MPSFASSSALSLPQRPVCAAIQRSSTLFEFPRLLRAILQSLTVLLLMVRADTAMDRNF